MIKTSAGRYYLSYTGGGIQISTSTNHSSWSSDGQVLSGGRSTNPTGPYSDASGVAMTAGGGTLILATHGSVIGPGGQTVMHDSDGDVLVYHYYDGNLNGTAQIGLNHLSWGSTGWPTVVSWRAVVLRSAASVRCCHTAVPRRTPVAGRFGTRG
jgi:beta-xylosidase